MFRILIADDSDDTRTFLRSALTSRGWTVCGEAANGRQAVLMASQLNPDLIIMDLSMPMLTGLEATREVLRARPKQPVILFTLHASPQLATAAANVGALKVISKADGLGALIAAVEKIAGASNPSGGNRGNPGSSSGPSLAFIDAPTSATDSRSTLKPGAASVQPHAEPVLAASASESGKIGDPAVTEKVPGKLDPSEAKIGEPASSGTAAGDASTVPPGDATSSDGPANSSQDPQA